jgi:hypothetical protein
MSLESGEGEREPSEVAVDGGSGGGLYSATWASVFAVRIRPEGCN